MEVELWARRIEHVRDVSDILRLCQILFKPTTTGASAGVPSLTCHSASTEPSFFSSRPATGALGILTCKHSFNKKLRIIS